MKVCLVFGARGLIGRAVVENLSKNSSSQIIQTPRIDWSSELNTKLGVTQAIHEWLKQPDCDEWEMYWCAGVGRPQSGVAANEQECSAYQTALQQIEQIMHHDQAQMTTAFFTSSAGGFYGPTGQGIATETTSTRPIEAYGRSKAALEQLTTELAQRTGVRTVIGRLSSIYGEHQDFRKRQGLIAHLAFSIAARQPITIFTNLATTRNYLDAATAGAVLVHYVQRSKEPTSIVRNICAPYDTSVAELLSLTKQVSGRRVEIAYTGAAEINNSRISSHFENEVSHLIRTTLPTEFAKLIQRFRMSVAESDRSRNIPNA